MKNNKVFIYVAATILLLVLFNIILAISLSKSNDKYKISKNNEKALMDRYDTLTNESRVLKLKLAQMQASGDSVMQELLKTQKELGIKNKNVKEIEYIKSEVIKYDTLRLYDTIFDDSFVVLDTLIGDRWVRTAVHLEYPNMISLETHALSEKTVILSTVKETIEPEKKFFVARWMQKKQKVLRAYIKDKNPYIIEKENLFIQIEK